MKLIKYKYLRFLIYIEYKQMLKIICFKECMTRSKNRAHTLGQF